MKYWEKSRKIKLDTLGRDFLAVYTNDIPKARDKRSKKLGSLEKPLSKGVDGLCCYNEDELTVFFDERASLGVIAHESYHVVCRIFDYIGVEDYDEELVAYHLGYITDEILKIKTK